MCTKGSLRQFRWALSPPGLLFLLLQILQNIDGFRQKQFIWLVKLIKKLLKIFFFIHYLPKLYIGFNGKIIYLIGVILDWEETNYIFCMQTGFNQCIPFTFFYSFFSSNCIYVIGDMGNKYFLYRIYCCRISLYLILPANV